MTITPEIIIVSGLPRSGTSLMMQMLERGGIELATDHQRPADDDNPHGYYELEAVKDLEADASWISSIRGKAIKVVSLLLYDLPTTEHYRVIFMERDLNEVIASQEAMLKHRGQTPPPREDIKEAFRQHLEQLANWLQAQSNMQLLHITYSELLTTPQILSEHIATFLKRPLDIEVMQSAIDPTLYRNRTH